MGTSVVSRWSDWLGMLAAIGCAIHCAAMPLVIAYLPTLGLSFLADEAFHKWMAVGCFAIAVSAFLPGFRKHRRFTPMIVGSLGLALISVAAFASAGACCPAGQHQANQVASTETAACADAHCQDCVDDSAAELAAAPQVVASSEATTCEDSDCHDCPSENAVALVSGSGDAPANVEPARAALLGFIWAWLTPFGGCVLVAAHLLNRRYGFQCSCCSGEGTEEDSPADDLAA